jgi:hypothetical protein
MWQASELYAFFSFNPQTTVHGTACYYSYMTEQLNNLPEVAQKEEEPGFKYKLTYSKSRLLLSHFPALHLI